MEKEGTRHAAYKLYNLLNGRILGYTVLERAFAETNQDGAYFYLTGKLLYTKNHAIKNVSSASPLVTVAAKLSQPCYNSIDNVNYGNEYNRNGSSPTLESKNLSNYWLKSFVLAHSKFVKVALIVFLLTIFLAGLSVGLPLGFKLGFGLNNTSIN